MEGAVRPTGKHTKGKASPIKKKKRKVKRKQPKQ